MSKKVFNLVGYSDSSDEEQDGDSEKQMAICGVPKMQSETEKQKSDLESDLESSGRKVAIVEPTVIEQNLDLTHSSPPSPLPPPPPPPPPPSPETFLDADTLAQDEMENVAQILLDFSVSGVIGSNQEEQSTTQESPVLITSPVSDVVSENEVINISSDSDTIPYAVSANSPDNRITIDDCFSIKSVTSGEIVINTRETNW